MFSTVIALGIVILQVCIVICLYLLATKSSLVPHIASRAHILLPVIFIGSALGSLVYEFVLGFEPCLLCWYQRIAIFGIAIISLTADLRKSALLRKQVLILALGGLAVALVHNYIDIFPTGLDICGAGPSCLKRYVHEFGYITIPMMSLTVLLGGALLGYITKRFPQGNAVQEEH